MDDTIITISDSDQSSLLNSTLDISMSNTVKVALIECQRYELTNVDVEVIRKFPNGNGEDTNETSIEIVGETEAEPLEDDRNTSTIGERDDMALIMKMIEFITQGPQLFFCFKPSTWQPLRESSKNIEDRFTNEELRDIFIVNILPKIFNLTISEATRKHLDILRCSPSFERINSGYLVKPMVKYQTANMPLVRNVDYRVVDARDMRGLQAMETEAENDDLNTTNSSTTRKFRLDTQKSNPAKPHLVVVVGEVDNQSQLSYKPSLQHILCSSVVALDYELLHLTCLKPQTILERLREAKRIFQNTGRLPETLNVQHLKDKLRKLQEFRKRIVEVVDSRYVPDMGDNSEPNNPENNEVL